MSATQTAFSIRRSRPSLPAADLLSFRERPWVRWFLLATDIIVFECCLALGFFVRKALSSWLEVEIRTEHFAGVAAGVLLVPLVQYFLNLYPGYCLGPVERLRRRTYTTVASFGALTAWDSLILNGTWSRGVLLFTLLFAVTLPPLIELLLRKYLIAQGCWGMPVLILGAGSTGTTLARVFHRDPHLGLVPVAFLDDDDAKWCERIEGVPVVGPLRMVHALRQSVEVVVLAMPAAMQAQITGIVRDLSFARILLVPNLFGMQTQWVTARDLGGCLGLELRKNLHIRRNWVVKRSLDYLLGIPALLLSMPLIGLLALWIKRASPGPVFYTQAREGLYGQTIRIWKLRTMHPNAEALLEGHFQKHPDAREHWQRHFKLKHDPRIIPGVGSFLRQTSLDELPQLWNIAKGEMSLVGPRPFPRYHMEEFPKSFRSVRCSVLPGLTGFWQVSSRSNSDLLLQEALDTYYISNWSVWLDLYVLMRTVVAVLARSGAY